MEKNEAESELVREEPETIAKIKELDRQIKETEKDIPAVTNTETPSPEEVEKHIASGHANFRRWCPD